MKWETSTDHEYMSLELFCVVIMCFFLRSSSLVTRPTVASCITLWSRLTTAWLNGTRHITSRYIPTSTWSKPPSALHITHNSGYQPIRGQCLTRHCTSWWKSECISRNILTILRSYKICSSTKSMDPLWHYQPCYPIYPHDLLCYMKSTILHNLPSYIIYLPYVIYPPSCTTLIYRSIWPKSLEITPLTHSFQNALQQTEMALNVCFTYLFIEACLWRTIITQSLWLAECTG